VRVVVDTNVAVVANGKSAQASPECVQTCVKRLRELTQTGRLVLDNRWLILKEYRANLRSDGQPGVGDAFLKWVLTNYSNPDRCELLTITPTDEKYTDFVEFPRSAGLFRFHSHDRKFVAVALAHPKRPPILQAVDTLWWEMKTELESAGVTVDFLCPNDMHTILQER